MPSYLDVEPDHAVVDFELAAVHVVHGGLVGVGEGVVEELPHDRRLAGATGAQHQDAVVRLGSQQVATHRAVVAGAATTTTTTRCCL